MNIACLKRIRRPGVGPIHSRISIVYRCLSLQTRVTCTDVCYPCLVLRLSSPYLFLLTIYVSYSPICFFSIYPTVKRAPLSREERRERRGAFPRDEKREGPPFRREERGEGPSKEKRREKGLPLVEKRRERRGASPREEKREGPSP